MIKGTIACVIGVAFALALLLPAAVSARSGFFRGGLHRAHAHANWPYGYGPVATYAPGDYAAPVVLLPAQAAPAPAPHCVHSRETIIVPAEAGGERKVTITRC
jgi:hypothetical protein